MSVKGKDELEGQQYDNTYIIDVLSSNEFHDRLQIRLRGRNTFLEQAKRILAQVQLVHHLVETLLDFRPQHIVGGSDRRVAKDLLLLRHWLHIFLTGVALQTSRVDSHSLRLLLYQLLSLQDSFISSLILGEVSDTCFIGHKDISSDFSRRRSMQNLGS